MKDNPKIAIKIMYKMLNVITQRLQNTGGFLTDMVRWGEDASKRAITDPFTGCYNRRFLDDKLDDFFTTAKNNQQPFSLVMIDLDYFRQINEAYGHEIGDKTILEVVNVFKEYLREKDVIARYGGDEFTVLMPETPLKQAEEVAKTICKKVSNLTLLEGLNGPIKTITLSQGIAAFPESSEELKELKEKADKALYKAKEDGRNRAVCYSSAAE
jgi:diguanylate cyclase (GGDEF)-like protein